MAIIASEMSDFMLREIINALVDLYRTELPGFDTETYEELARFFLSHLTITVTYK